MFEGKKVYPSLECGTRKYVLSLETLPDRPIYLEVVKEHLSGCYDSLGLCRSK